MMHGTTDIKYVIAPAGKFRWLNKLRRTGELYEMTIELRTKSV
jgi:hypothetical protein